MIHPDINPELIAEAEDAAAHYVVEHFDDPLVTAREIFRAAGYASMCARIGEEQFPAEERVTVREHLKATFCRAGMETETTERVTSIILSIPGVHEVSRLANSGTPGIEPVARPTGGRRDLHSYSPTNFLKGVIERYPRS